MRGRTAPLTLQNLSLPGGALEADLLPDPALFLHLSEGAEIRAGRIHLPPHGGLVADGWMNLFPLARWRRAARVEGLHLALAGEGAGEVALTVPGAEAPLWRGEVTLATEGVKVAPEIFTAPEAAPLLALAFTAGPGGAVLNSAAFRADPGRADPGRADPGRADPGDSPPLRLALAITTFRREAEVTQTAARITAFLERGGGDLGDHAHLFVIDNGQTLTLPAHPRLTVIPNRNLGGAGGWARALAAARAGGFSHCLFMDDDAAMPMENLVRTAAFLRLARSPRAAVAGAMISTAAPTRIWENGAVFDRFCRPLSNDTDLTDPAQVIAMEEKADQPRPRGFYGGFWFFAFPLAGLRHDPFPFFVRGDDISFSLANRLDTVTLPGVVSLQEDFGHKESPQTLYLDLRNHLHHHLVQEGMEIGRLRTAGIALRFILRSLVRMHYASAAAQCLSWADAMEGPQIYETHADMKARRALIAEFSGAEVWKGSDAAEPPPARPPSRLLAWAMKFTLNGHLLPFFGALGARRGISIAERAPIWPFWGAAEMRIVDAGAGRAYRVRHDKGRAFAILARAAGLALRWQFAYPRLRRAYRDSYGPMTTPDSWARRFADRGTEG